MAPFPKPPFPKKKRGSVYAAPLHEEVDSKKLCYINITILDATDAVYQIVHAKVQDASWVAPRVIKDMVAHNVAKTVSTQVSKKEVARKISNKIPKMLMYRLYHKMGMQVAAKVVFREDAYAVIQIQIQHVDSKRLLALAKQEVCSATNKQDDEDGQSEGTTKLKYNKTKNDDADEVDDHDSVSTAVLDEWIMEQKKMMQEEQESAFVTFAQEEENENHRQHHRGWKYFFVHWKEAVVLLLAWILTKLVPVTITRDLESETLPALIQSQISANLKQILDQKLASKSMRAETAVLSEEAQARYFFAQLQNIRSKDKCKTDGDDGKTRE